MKTTNKIDVHHHIFPGEYVDTLKELGLEGRKWAVSEESGMSSKEMCSRFIKHINFLLENWTPTENFTVTKVDKFESSFSENIGITW